MQTSPTIFVELYSPLMLAIVCVFVFCRTVRGQKRTIFNFKPFGSFVEYKFEVSNIFLIRGSLVVALVGCFASYLLYDYESFFPQDYKMEVFFDERGLSQSLSMFSANELKDLSIPAERSKYRELYVQQLDAEVQKAFGDPAFFGGKAGYVYSTGHAQFAAEKTGGWQNYHVVASEGQLTHFYDAPNQPHKEFYTKFEKLPSADDYLSVTMSDLYVRHSIVLRTQYKQFLVQNKMSEALLFKLTLVGITKVTIFPWPHVSDTVYLARFENVRLVPVAYAVYR